MSSLLFRVASKSIGVLIDEGKYLYGVEQDVRGLQDYLESMQTHLLKVDANPNLVKQEDLLLFTKKIQVLAFRAEDAIDTYVVDVGAKIDRKHLFLKVACLISHSYPVHMLVKEIEAIQKEIQKASDRFQNFRIPELSNNSTSVLPTQVGNYEDLGDHQVVGIQGDIERLANRLTSSQDNFKVLAIVGTGGAGKTTLARELYNHVANSFPHKAFVRVSREWKKLNLLSCIFTQLVKGRDKNAQGNLEEDLKNLLKDKPCLIVLDDIWDTEAWDAISVILPRTNNATRVIITTRIEKVVLHADNRCITHEPQLLTKEQKWELFSKVAMEGRPNIENDPQFKELGEKMLEKCEGLPFAVVALAGILKTKADFFEWEQISKACNELIFREKRAVLETSYIDLHTPLKPCFLYLAIMPNDCDIEAQMLIQMWIAEGFITNDLQLGQDITLEDAAMLVLNELARRCILRVTSKSVRGHIERCRIHDLMRKFCIEKAKESHFLGTDSFPTNQNAHPRRIAIFSSENNLEEYNHLRTLVQYDKSLGQWESNPDGAMKFKLLRILNIWGVDHVALPKHIGNLLQLRYLGINATRISKLPKSVRNLSNILYLCFRSPGNLGADDPIDLLSKMKNLRGVVLPHLVRGSFKSLGLTHSQNLQSLTSGACTWMIEELPKLSLTVKNLEIYEIKEMGEIEAIYQCPGITKGGLCTLKCDYKLPGLEFDLQKLMQCTTLWSLELNGLLKDRCGRAIQFPPKLEKLSLSGSRIEEWPDLMQVLGDLAYLKCLSLSYGAYLGMQLHCTARAFPALQELHLVSLENLEEWRMEEGAMSRLSKIDIEDCLKLKRLPESIRSITTLKELNIKTMPKDFCERLGNGGDDHNIVEKITSVNFL